MAGGWYGLLELLLVLGSVFGLAAWQLLSLRSDARRGDAESRARKPPRSGPDGRA